MPHLAPLKWFLALISFTLLLLITLSTTWWTLSPNIPKMNPASSPVSFSHWAWY